MSGYLGAFLNNEMNKRFVAAFQAKFHTEPEKGEFLGFEGMWLVAQAVKKAGTTTDTAKLAATLRESTWQTPRGTIRFEKNQAVRVGERGVGFFNLTVKDGRIVVTE